MAMMKAAQVVAVGKPLELVQIDVPAISPTDVLVKVAGCGIVPNFANIVNGRTNHLMPELPAVMGLDVAGVIEAVGEHVSGLHVGQRVYVNPYITCGTCEHCHADRTDLCGSGVLRGYFANTPAGLPLLKRYPVGGLAEYVASPDRNIVRLPDNVDMMTAARFGYAGTSFAGLRRGGLMPGKTLLVNGVSGTLGVAAVAIALGLGASRVLGIGRRKDMLDRVKALAPTRIATLSADDDRDIARWVASETNGAGIDVVYDCLGTGAGTATTQIAFEALKAGGRAMLTGGTVNGEIGQSYIGAYKDVSVAGSNWVAMHDFDRMAAMISASLIDMSYLENAIFNLDEVNQAVSFVGDRPGGFTNTVVVPNN